MSRLPASLAVKLVECIESLLVDIEEKLDSLHAAPSVDLAHEVADILDEAIEAVESLLPHFVDAACAEDSVDSEASTQEPPQ